MKNPNLAKTSKVQVLSAQNEVLQNKNVNDIIYSYLNLCSLKDLDENSEYKYCFKSEVTPTKIIKYYTDGVNKRCPFSERTIRTHLKALIAAGLLEEEERYGKKIYHIFPLTKSFVKIPTDTLQFLIYEGNPNKIKVYVYLKHKFEANKIFNMEEPFRFSKTGLAKQLGYSDYQNVLDGLEAILISLRNNGLISYHKAFLPSESGKVTQYYILDNVSDTYIGDENPPPLAKQGKKYIELSLNKSIKIVRDAEITYEIKTKQILKQQKEEQSIKYNLNEDDDTFLF